MNGSAVCMVHTIKRTSREFEFWHSSTVPPSFDMDEKRITERLKAVSSPNDRSSYQSIANLTDLSATIGP
jgi:hypothetical protein